MRTSSANQHLIGLLGDSFRFIYALELAIFLAILLMMSSKKDSCAYLEQMRMSSEKQHLLSLLRDLIYLDRRCQNWLLLANRNIYRKKMRRSN